MNTKNTTDNRRMIQIRKRIFACMAACLLMGSLILSHSMPVQAGVFDFAMGKLRYTATVAEIVVSLLTGSGAAVTNTSYLSQLNAAYGVESSIGTLTGTDGTLGAMYEAGLFSIDSSGAFIDNGLLSAIESVPEYTELGISDYMATWAVEDGVNTITQTAAENIGSSIGAASVAGTLCQVAGAVGIGVSLGVLANNFIEKYQGKMAVGQAINENIGYAGGQMGYANYKYGQTQGIPEIKKFAIQPEGMIVLKTDTNVVYFLNKSSQAISGKIQQIMSNPPWVGNSSPSVSAYSYYQYSSNMRDYNMSGVYQTTDSIQNVLNRFINGTLTYDPPSPDVIGPAGNQRPSNYSDTANPLSWPDLKPQTPEGKGITAIPWDNYMDFVDDANTNTYNNNTTTIQGDTYNNFITNYYVTPDTIETPEENPDINQGETVTSPDYNPTVPEQPTPNEKPEVSQSEAQENTDIMTTPGLKDVFPFCIPWDIAALFTKLNSGARQAPVITIPFVSNLFGIDEEVTIDLSAFDTAAAILRTLELIGFAIGLAMVTRSLIGAR